MSEVIASYFPRHAESDRSYDLTAERDALYTELRVASLLLKTLQHFDKLHEDRLTRLEPQFMGEVCRFVESHP